jgi:RecA-family ATPase
MIHPAFADRETLAPIRLNDIARAEGLALSDLADFYVVPLAGLDAVMGTPDAGGIVRPTKLWSRFVDLCEARRPRMIALDTLADVFGGDENVRTQARQFVGQLRGLAIKLECAVLLLAHPSLSGMASGAGTSGSTGWNNSVRGRLYLTRPKDGPLSKDPNIRVLTTKKENYSGGYGDERLLRWEAGRFATFEKRVSIEAEVDDLFLSLLDEFTAQNRNVHHEPGKGYVCSEFSQAKRAAGTSKDTFKDAMNRLLSAGKIEIVEFGPPSRRRRKLARKIKMEFEDLI